MKQWHEAKLMKTDDTVAVTINDINIRYIKKVYMDVSAQIIKEMSTIVDNVVP